jgi:hypothetical protein
MKRTDTITKIAMLLLFVGMLAYMGVYVSRAVQNPLRTSPAVMSSVRFSAEADGIVVREEKVLSDSHSYRSLSVQDGRRVAAGVTLATAYDSEIALERANRMRELELEISLDEAVLAGKQSAEDLLSYNTAVRTAILDLAKDIARHDLAETDRHSLNLSSLVFEDAAASVTQEGLDALKQELQVLQNSSTSDTVSLNSEESGLFSTVLDGYEDLDPDDLAGLSPEGLRALMGGRLEVAAGAYGKLITSFNWYFAAVMNEADAQNFGEGGSASLEFGRYYSAPLEAYVLTVGEPDGAGKCVVVFSLDRAMADTLAMRLVSAEVVFRELKGIRVPYEAVHTDGGQAFVYTVTGLVCERKDIEIVCDTGEYYLAQTGGELRIGNDIILGGRDLYDGKILD